MEGDTGDAAPRLPTSGSGTAHRRCTRTRQEGALCADVVARAAGVEGGRHRLPRSIAVARHILGHVSKTLACRPIEGKALSKDNNSCRAQPALCKRCGRAQSSRSRGCFAHDSTRLQPVLRRQPQHMPAGGPSHTTGGTRDHCAASWLGGVGPGSVGSPRAMAPANLTNSCSGREGGGGTGSMHMARGRVSADGEQQARCRHGLPWRGMQLRAQSGVQSTEMGRAEPSSRRPVCRAPPDPPGCRRPGCGVQTA